jgi:hypothetical protein
MSKLSRKCAEGEKAFERERRRKGAPKQSPDLVETTEAREPSDDADGVPRSR